MLTQKWRKILAAKAVLGLGDLASIEEIRAAYRKRCKEHHPDRVVAGEISRMQEINAAYGLLLEYGKNFRLPLLPPEGSATPMDPEDWWLDRFGEDPLWGRRRDG